MGGFFLLLKVWVKSVKVRGPDGNNKHAGVFSFFTHRGWHCTKTKHRNPSALPSTPKKPSTHSSSFLFLSNRQPTDAPAYPNSPSWQILTHWTGENPSKAPSSCSSREECWQAVCSRTARDSFVVDKKWAACCRRTAWRCRYVGGDVTVSLWHSSSSKITELRTFQCWTERLMVLIDDFNADTSFDAGHVLKNTRTRRRQDELLINKCDICKWSKLNYFNENMISRKFPGSK